MRVDASNLLNRLGRHDFSYKEFEDRFTELELWPMLEALLKDPRLQELDPSLNAVSPSTEAPAMIAPGAPLEADASQPQTPTPVETATESIGALFRRYEGQDPAPTPASASGSGQNVRAMLRHLSDLGARGEI